MSKKVRLYFNYWLKVFTIGISIIPVQLMVADHHLYTASACAAGTSCRTLNITCGSGTRIQIVSGFYGKRTTSAASIGSRPDCKGACLHDGECCAYTPGDGNKTVSRSDLRELKEQCSWMPDCSPGVPYKRDYLYATIFYYCTPEPVVFCENTNYTNTRVNILLKDPPWTLNNLFGFTECVCLVQVETLKAYELKAKDVRLNDNNEICMKKSWSDDSSYTCINGSAIPSLGDSWNQSFDTTYKVRLRKFYPPPMVWIQMQGSGDGASISVECYGPGQKQKDVAVVSFCDDTQSKGSRINMVLLREVIPKHDMLECQCRVEVANESHEYVWNLQEVEMNHSSQICYSNLSTQEATPLCINKSNLEYIKTVEKFPLLSSVFTLKFQRTAIPQMVWLQVKGLNYAELSVKCDRPNAAPELSTTVTTVVHSSPTTPTPTQQDTTPMSTSRPSTTLTSKVDHSLSTTSTPTQQDKTPVSTNTPSTTLTINFDTSSSSTSTPFVDGPKALGSEESDSSNLPLPAIVAPIIGIILALSVLGFFVWRRRYKSQSSSQKKADQNLQREMAVCNTSYNDAQQMYDSLKNSFKEPDNTYLSISKDTDNFNATDKEKTQNKSNNENNMYSTLEEQETKLYKSNSDYTCLENSSKEPDNIYLSITKDGVKHTDHFDATAEETTLNKSNNESNMYSALEERETALYKSLSDYNGVKNDVSIQSKQSDPEQENSYFILEPNVSNAESPVHTKCGDAKKPTLQETEANDYFVLEPETDNSTLTTDSDLVRPTPDEISKDNSVTNEYFILEPNLQEPQHNDYFVLEPEIDNSALATDSDLIRPTPDEISKDNNVTNEYFILEPNLQETEPNDYFVLEPEIDNSASATDSELVRPASNGISEENCVKYQANNSLTNNYFTLEPQDTYSSIDPHDVDIQTLPDNEYNTLHEIKNEGPDTASRFNAGKKTEGTDDYSHITNTALAGNDVIDYSHVKFNKEPLRPEYNSMDSQYSHLNL